MQADSIVDAIERFFLDIVGTVVPGAAALLAASAILGGPLALGAVSLTPSTEGFNWIVFIFGSYGAGHVVTSLGENILVKALDALVTKIRGTGKTLLFVEPESELMQKISVSAPYKALMSEVTGQYPWSVTIGSDVKRNVRDLRSVALTVAKDDSATVYRFRFLSLLNLGLATVLLTTAAAWLTARLLHLVRLPFPVQEANWWLLVGVVVLSAFFLERRYMFYGMSQRVPFSMAIGQLLKLISDPAGKRGAALAGSVDRRKMVYLAGGLRSNWQDKPMQEAPGFEYRDPRSHGLSAGREYTLWDLEAVRASDIVFAYLEPSNPSGYGLSLEIGYGKALGKRVILVDEKTAQDATARRYFEIVRATADLVFDSLDEGVSYLNRLSSAY